MATKCAGCGKHKEGGKKYCPTCRDKLEEMKNAGYLKPVPMLRNTPTTFNDSRGRHALNLGSATNEDDYGEEAGPED